MNLGDHLIDVAIVSMVDCYKSSSAIEESMNNRFAPLPWQGLWWRSPAAGFKCEPQHRGCCKKGGRGQMLNN